MEKIAVGKPYKGNYRTEGIKFIYNEGFHLNIFLKDLKADEILDIKKGSYNFGLTIIEGLLFFTCSFGESIELSDVPFDFGLYTDGRVKELPAEIAEGKGLALNITAIDSHTGIVKAIRLIGLSTKFSRSLIAVSQSQSTVEVNRNEYGIKLMKVQNTYSSKDIYSRAVIRCAGNSTK